MSVERGAFLHAAGLRTHVLRSGPGGAPILLLHGLGSLGQEILAPLRDIAPGRSFVAPDRPGYGLSDPLQINPGPIGQAHWLRWVIDAMSAGPPLVVAHSMGAATALAFATLYPERLRGLVLIAPFCRPTPHALMLGLRLATMPVVGPFLNRTVIPRIAPAIGARRLRQAFAPAPVPPSLRGFPFAHAVSAGAQKAMSAELRAFNRDMTLCRRTKPQLEVPLHVLCAPDDSVVDLQWHLTWLTDWARGCVLHFLRAGHMIHHAQPAAALVAINALEAQVGGRVAA